MTCQELTDIRAQKVAALIAAGRYEDALKKLQELIAEIKARETTP
jgi:DNA-binding SARP family transcriptional activator